MSLPDPCDRGAAGPCGSSAQQTTGQSHFFAIYYLVSVFFVLFFLHRTTVTQQQVKFWKVHEINNRRVSSKLNSIAVKMNPLLGFPSWNQPLIVSSFVCVCVWFSGWIKTCCGIADTHRRCPGSHRQCWRRISSLPAREECRRCSRREVRRGDPTDCTSWCINCKFSLIYKEDLSVILIITTT